MAISINNISEPLLDSGASPITFSITTSVGNLLIATIYSDPGVAVSGVTDSASQTWTSTGFVGTSSVDGNAYIFYKLNSVAGVTSITVAFSPTSSTAVSVAVFDCQAAGGGVFQTANEISNYSGSFNPSLVASTPGLCIISIVSSAPPPLGISAPFTETDPASSGAFAYPVAAYYVNPAAGTLTCTAVQNSAVAWVIAEFREVLPIYALGHT